MKIQLNAARALQTVLVLCLLAMTALVVADTPGSESAFTHAMAQYRQGRWSAAYGRFCRLADQGNPEAARIALVMLRHGVTMYGTNWSASQPQIDHWMKLAQLPMAAPKSETGD